MFHRIDGLAEISAHRFFRLVTRLSAYGGVLTARFATPAAAPAIEQPTAPHAPLPGLDITPQNADALLNNELYGALPGMGPVFSHSYAPLVEGD